MTKEDYWKILNGECNLRQMINIISPEKTKKEIDDLMDDIKEWDQYGCSMFFSFVSAYQNTAYQRLVALGEIDSSKFFHLHSKSTEFKEVDLRLYDTAYKGDKMYRWNKGNWELLF